MSDCYEKHIFSRSISVLISRSILLLDAYIFSKAAMFMSVQTLFSIRVDKIYIMLFLNSLSICFFFKIDVDYYGNLNIFAIYES